MLSVGVEGTHDRLVLIVILRVLGHQGVEHLPVHRALVVVTKARVTGAGEVLLDRP